MRPFDYVRADDIAAAVREGTGKAAYFIAGGTNLVDLMKDHVEQPDKLVDVNSLPFHHITAREDGGLRLGVLATNAATAYHPRIASDYPLLSSAILAGASAQLRNAATNGGNLNQRTRCYYFYDTSAACNKRVPGSGCDAIGGFTRAHAILGGSPHCIATQPSDMSVALLALDAEVHVTGPAGDRVIPIAGYHRLPGNEPWRDNHLADGELVTAIDLPAERFNEHYTYLKLRDRQSYAFALVSVAVAMQLDGDQISDARVSLGGVAHKPWRRTEADALMIGRSVRSSRYDDVAEALLAGAVGRGDNDFKIDLARRAIVRACMQAAAGTPQSQSDKRIA